jgi:hypothetical protein
MEIPRAGHFEVTIPGAVGDPIVERDADTGSIKRTTLHWIRGLDVTCEDTLFTAVSPAGARSTENVLSLRFQSPSGQVLLTLYKDRSTVDGTTTVSPVRASGTQQRSTDAESVLSNIQLASVAGSIAESIIEDLETRYPST